MFASFWLKCSAFYGVSLDFRLGLPFGPAPKATSRAVSHHRELDMCSVLILSDQKRHLICQESRVGSLPSISHRVEAADGFGGPPTWLLELGDSSPKPHCHRDMRHHKLNCPTYRRGIHFSNLATEQHANICQHSNMPALGSVIWQLATKHPVYRSWRSRPCRA